MPFDVHVVRVFTDDQGRWGNPLGIVDATAVAPSDRQSVAHELQYSETVFVDVPTGPVDSTALRIHTPAVELPFAGHPTVGTAAWLADRGTPVETLLVPAGEVAVRVADGVTYVRARPAWAPQFEFHRVSSPADVLDVDPSDFTEGHHYVWAWVDEDRGAIRSRMFAPDMGVPEDEATGAAAVRVTELLGRDLGIVQGRGSVLSTTLSDDGWVELGGRVVVDESRTL
ncbi:MULTISPECIES: PhzF family phenazine biosynthesis protein [Nocardiaceae]|uniref:PhzF superfamily epimerase YddE/YHI9 n=1 Tax=Rhodococcoides corynebacterioides TaxID=53972 RepID=A0ABS2KSR0_9NOCA|nr:MULTISPECIES: PhzF family phenazine biosynthesis protein [Rhodococcus]MBM7414816.1 putative PhzF superfamily epimerase YddE/YHI9 [Rhodococcus corynebacterioides]MBP1117278.1 putative PhzF superfamily epimerase YddE/YHI9 [Rhodococcus sp. PvP016]